MDIDKITHDREKNLFWLHCRPFFVGTIDTKAIFNETKDWLEEKGFGTNIVTNVDYSYEPFGHVKVGVSFVEDQDSTMMKLMCDEF